MGQWSRYKDSIFIRVKRRPFLKSFVKMKCKSFIQGRGSVSQVLKVFDWRRIKRSEERVIYDTVKIVSLCYLSN